jgi:hypothetical protein
LGWFLGVLSPVASDLILQQRRKAEFMKAVTAELRELQFRLALVAERIDAHLCVVDREFMKITLRIVERFDGPERTPDLLASFRSHFAKSDTELKAIYAALRRPGDGLRLSTYSLPLLESHLQLLASCRMDYQRRVLQIRTILGFFNDEVNTALRLTEMTFDSTLTDQNHRIVKANIEESQLKLAKRAREIVALVTEYEASFPWLTAPGDAS